MVCLTNLYFYAYIQIIKTNLVVGLNQETSKSLSDFLHSFSCQLVLYSEKKRY
jgi:hypothetical protein